MLCCRLKNYSKNGNNRSRKRIPIHASVYALEVSANQQYTQLRAGILILHQLQKIRVNHRVSILSKPLD